MFSVRPEGAERPSEITASFQLPSHIHTRIELHNIFYDMQMQNVFYFNVARTLLPHSTGGSCQFLVNSNSNNHGFPCLIFITIRNFLPTSYYIDNRTIMKNENWRINAVGTYYHITCRTLVLSRSSDCVD